MTHTAQGSSGPPARAGATRQRIAEAGGRRRKQDSDDRPSPRTDRGKAKAFRQLRYLSPPERADTDAKRKAIESAYQSLTPEPLPDWTADQDLLEWLDRFCE